MNGDFTRLSHRPDKRYAKVLRQQGRVGLEADDNEGTDIQESIATRTTADVVGASGVPVHAAGFRLSQTPDGQDLAISPGRLYLDGLLLEVTATEMVVAVASDKATVTVPLWDVDGQGFKDGQWVEVWNPGGTRSVRKVQALSKAARTIKLATPAGIDATARVLLRRLPTYRTQPDRLRLPAGEPAGAFWLGGGTYAAVLDAFPRHITVVEDPELQEVALGGPDTTTRVKNVWQLRILAADPGDTCTTDLAKKGWPPAPSDARLTASVAPDGTSDTPCILPAQAGYTGLENRLYRVEVHAGGALGQATFKWSRDNASNTVAIDGFDASGLKVQVRRLGRDQVLALRKGDIVELLDDATELAGQPGELRVVDDVVEATNTVLFTQAVTAAALDLHPKLRRWDMRPTGTSPAILAPPIEVGKVLKLEAGAQVEFAGSTFTTGDWWVFAARTATGEVEPLRSAPPRGPGRHHCRIAMLSGGAALKIVPCVPQFLPLTEPATCCLTVGDGVDTHGEHTDIQAAVDALPASGGCVLVLPGLYKLTDPVNLPSNVRLEGCEGRATLQAARGEPAVTALGAHGCSVANLRLVATGSNWGALFVAGAHGFRAEECDLDNAPASPEPGGQPALLAMDHQGKPCTGLEVAACRLAGNVGASVRVAGLRLEGSRFATGGLWLRHGTSNATVRGNRIGGGPGWGILLGGAVEGDPDEPEAWRKGRGAVWAGKAGAHFVGTGPMPLQDIHIEGNRIAGMAEAGIGWRVLGGMRGLRVVDNLVEGCATHPTDPVGAGVAIALCDDLLLRGNTVRGNGPARPTFGLLAVGCRSLVVEGNRVHDNGVEAAPAGAAAKEGFQFQAAAVLAAFGGAGRPAMQVHDNLFACPRGPALLAGGAGSCAIHDNELLAAGDWAAGDRLRGRAVVLGALATERASLQGRLRFDGNRVLWTAPGGPATPPAQGASNAKAKKGAKTKPDAGDRTLLAYAWTDLALEGNHVRCEVEGWPRLEASVEAHALSVRATGNRFEETGGLAPLRIVRHNTGKPEDASDDVFALKAPQNHAPAIEGGDVLLVPPAGKVPGAAVLATDPLVGKGLPAPPATVLYADIPHGAEGLHLYGPGDAVYLSSDPSRLVATRPGEGGAYTIRLTRADDKAAGTLVLEKDPDLAKKWTVSGTLRSGLPGIGIFDAESGGATFTPATDRLYVAPGPLKGGETVPWAAVRISGEQGGQPRTRFGTQAVLGDVDFLPTLKSVSALQVVRLERGTAGDISDDVFVLKAPQNVANPANPTLQVGDVLLVANSGKAAGSLLQDTDTTLVGQKGVMVPVTVFHADVDANTRYSLGDFVYLSSSPNGLVPTRNNDFTIRLTPAGNKGAGTLVFAADSDFISYGASANKQLRTGQAPQLGLFDPWRDGKLSPSFGDLYLAPGAVTNGDPVPWLSVRLTGNGLGFGTQAKLGDADFLPTLKPVQGLRIVRRRGDGASHPEIFVLKAPKNDKHSIEVGDVLLVTVGTRKAGTLVQGADGWTDQGALVSAKVFYRDADSSGHYGLGDGVYLSSSPNGPVASQGADFTLRLTNAGGKQAGTLVMAGDPDLSGPGASPALASGGAPQVALFDARGDGTLGNEGLLYLTPGPVTEGSLVPWAAVRLHAPADPQGKLGFGTQAKLDDPDFRPALVAVGGHPPVRNSYLGIAPHGMTLAMGNQADHCIHLEGDHMMNVHNQELLCSPTQVSNRHSQGAT